MRVRLFGWAWLVAALAVGWLGCEAQRVVDCGGGRFARSGADAWCFYAAASTTRCPSLLPVSHTLPWGERGCAAVRFDPPPPDLCVAAGRCPDGGLP